MKKTAVIERNQLRQLINDKFNDSELRDLYYDLGVGYDDLTAGGKLDKARELINWAERNGQMDALLTALTEAKPGVPWSLVLSPQSLVVVHQYIVKIYN